VLQSASETLNTRYFHTDHLGSISVITDENGLVVERLSYDAWGKRRFANGADDPSGSITSQSTRGFTGEEELSVSGLVHLNGRVYDPLLARFTSADTITENPFSTQGWNRYSYVGNDPLAFTDPSGHCFLGCFWQHIVSNPIVRAIVQIVATVVLAAVLTPVAVAVGFAAAAASTAAGIGAAALSASIVTGLSGGNLGQVLRAGLIAGATAFAFDVVGSATNAAAGQGFDLSAEHVQPGFDTPGAYAVNVAGHALVGCASSAASGGSCESGALSGGITAAAGPLINGQRFGVALVENAVLGGAASVAGGGKFANGAITGAFGYMYNAMGGRIVGGIIGGLLEGGLGVETGPADALLIAHGIYEGGKIGSSIQDWVTAKIWPSSPEEMDAGLGIDGERIPDGPNTPGRNKVIWTPNEDTKITYEQHPYHPDAPEWHSGPHWHLDTPDASHQRFLPGQPLPGN
jgi:RHS repeat-associated protein